MQSCTASSCSHPNMQLKALLEINFVADCSYNGCPPTHAGSCSNIQRRLCITADSRDNKVSRTFMKSQNRCDKFTRNSLFLFRTSSHFIALISISPFIISITNEATELFSSLRPKLMYLSDVGAAKSGRVRKTSFMKKVRPHRVIHEINDITFVCSNTLY